jgi:hypothetical protein
MQYGDLVSQQQHNSLPVALVVNAYLIGMLLLVILLPGPSDRELKSSDSGQRIAVPA